MSMKRRSLVISLDHNLPARPKGLSFDAMAKLFGGNLPPNCIPVGSPCRVPGAPEMGCCRDLNCRLISSAGQFLCTNS